MKVKKKALLLLVEDEAVQSALSANILREKNYEIISAASSQQAIDHINQNNFDLVLMDLDLGKKNTDGALAAKEILKIKEVPIVFFSYQEEKEVEAAIKDIPCYGYVLKDSGDFVLLQTVKSALKLFQVEKKARESEKRYNELFNTHQVAIIIYKAIDQGDNFIITDLNQRTVDLEGVSKEAAVGKLLTEVFPSAEEFGILDVLRRVWNTGRQEEFSNRYYEDDQRWGWRDNYIYKRSDGQLCVTYLDISKEKKLENDLAAARDILDKSAFAAFIWKNEIGWPVAYVSDNIKKIISYEASDFLSGKIKYLDIIHVNDRKRVEEEVEFFSQGYGSFQHSPYRIRKKNGKIIWINDQTNIIRDAQGNIIQYQGLINDITMRIDAEDELAEKRRELLCLHDISQLAEQAGISLEEFLKESCHIIQESISTLKSISVKIVCPPRIYLSPHFKERPFLLESIIDQSNDQPVLLQIFYDDQFEIDKEDLWLSKTNEFVQTLADKIQRIRQIFINLNQAKASEEKFKSLLSAISDGVYIIDRDWNIVLVNEAGSKYSPLSKEQLLGANLCEISKGFEGSETHKMLESVMEKGQAENISSVYTFSDGHTAWYDISAIPVPEGLLCISRDISDLKEEEQKSQNNEKEREEILKTIIEGIVIVDLQGQFVYANPAAEEILGTSKEKLLGSHFSNRDWQQINQQEKLFPLNQLPLTIALQKKERVKNIVHSIIIPTGKRRWISVNAAPLLDTNRKLYGAVASFRDITEEREAVKKLQHSEEKFRLAMDATDDGLWDWDILSGKVYYSPGYHRMLGYEAGELAGKAKSWKELLHPEDKKEAVRINRDCINGKMEAFSIEFRLKHKLGHWIWVLGRGKAVKRDKRGRAQRLIGTHLDISGFKKLIQEKDFLMRELNHRIKNNLMMVNSLIKLKESSPEPCKNLSDLKYQIDAIRIVHDKLNKSGEIEYIDFREYALDLLNSLFTSFSSQKIYLNAKISQIKFPAKTTIPLGLIINELATNAVKHGFKEMERPEFTISLRKNRSGEYVFKIGNNGSSLPKDLDPENSHSLGLSLVYALIRQIRGNLEIKKSPHPLFTFRFPKL